ncbi:hypothetical protein GXW74_23350 [Roseomonas eburnea]|uniref:AraC family transcriptional regulator n=1 Tax=Neoroseomonas eburnea TaxID=1346889 RepID=A0A9X9XIA6_9PROT|nr:hypothetical protein [Neoroseomonas eburnea]MBR0683442.1 hypothetical protein [Neoroseomonas eburnea]
MSRVLLLPAAAWMPQPTGGYAAVFAAPLTGRLAVWAEGLDTEAASLVPHSGPELPFLRLGGTAFATGSTLAREVFRLHALTPARRCVVIGLPAPRHSPTLDAFLPRALARPATRPAPDLPAARARMDAALAGQDLDGALAALADLLILARDAPATRDAVAALLAHLARHPLCRSLGLGAFAAALTE